MTTAQENLFDVEPDGLGGINAFYRDSLRPRLKSLEEQRRKAKGTRETFHRILIPVWLFCGLSVFVWGSFLLILPVALLTGFGLYYTHRERVELERRHRSVVFSGFAQFLGLQYNPKGLPVMVPHYQGLGLLPERTEILCEDGVRGAVGAVDFQTMAIRFQTRARWRLFGSRDDNIHARLLSLRLQSHVPGPVTVVPRRTGPLWQAGLLPEGSAPIDLDDKEFQRAFQVFSKDHAAARSLLAPEAMRCLTDLSERYGGACVCFQDRGGHLLLGTANPATGARGEPGFADPQFVRDVLEILFAARRLTDGLTALGTA